MTAPTMTARGPRPGAEGGAAPGAGGRLAQLGRNKPLLLGAGVVGLVVVIAMVRKGGGGGLLAGDPDGETGIGNPANLNTVGTDVAAQLGQFDASMAAQLAEFGQSLTETLEAIKDMDDGSAPKPPVKPVPIIKKPAPRKVPRDPRRYVTVVPWRRSGTPWNSTLSGIASRYKTSIATLLRLNPTIKNRNVIHPGQRIRVS